MDFGIVQFTSDRGLRAQHLAPLIEDAGFAAYYVPEHSHIPTKREAAHPRTGDASCPTTAIRGRSIRGRHWRPLPR